MIHLRIRISKGYTAQRMFLFFTAVLWGIFLIGVFFGFPGCTRIEEEGNNGELVIGITDSEGDFIRYRVDVLALTLAKASGAAVETLPLATEVDFAQYTEMTEFVTAATVPSGLYTRAIVALDFRDADIWYEDANGVAVRVDTVLDAEDREVTTIEIPVHLESTGSLFILPGIPAHLTIDFNLEASNRIHDTDPNVMILQPVLFAEVNPEAPKIHRLRGPLKGVDADEGTFQVIIRPFVHLISGGDEDFGLLQVATNSSTVYMLNGDLYQGQIGLEELESMPPLAATVVIGDLSMNPRRFLAREVRAGSSVAGGTLDVVTGNVTSRDPNALTVRGATLIRSDGSILFNDSVSIQVDANTNVFRQFESSLQDTNDLSVGQRAMIFGTLTQVTPDPRMDADCAIMLLTTLRGTVVGKGTGQLTLRVQGIDARRAGIFDFSGTGSIPSNDADPNNYEITTGTLDISSLQAGTPVKVLGFVTAFGRAPDDFTAHTIVDVSKVPALMTVGWFPADPNALTTISANGLTLDLDHAGLFHHLVRAGVILDLKDLTQSTSIRPVTGETGIFSIDQDLSRQSFFSFADFAGDVQERIEDGGGVRRLIAFGLFDDANARLTASNLNIGIE
ncbi:MAG: metallophosphoesterase [bacterium]